MPIVRRLAVLAVLVPVVVGARPAGAQIDCVLFPTDPACVSSTTTTPAEESTSTTEAPVETTVRATTTTEPVVEETTSSTLEDTTTTSLPALLEEGPPPAAGGAPATASTTATTVAPVSDGGTSTGRQVALIVTGLVVLAVVFGLLTYWYWRRTRPGVGPAAQAS